MKARYSEHYKISAEELAWLTEQVDMLRGLTVTVCQERLGQLRDEADGSDDQP